MSFAQLLREVEKVEGLERIRFMTPHPKDLSDELIEVMATSKKVCKHMHLPMQSGSSRLLKLMNRHYTKEQYIALAKKNSGENPWSIIYNRYYRRIPWRDRRRLRRDIRCCKRSRIRQCIHVCIFQTFWNTSSKHGGSGR